MKTLETERLILRNWTLEDAEDLFDYAISHRVGPAAGWPPHRSIDESRRIIEMFILEDDVYAIELKQSGRVIGSIGIHNRKPDDTITIEDQREIGFVLNPTYWGRGIMPEAVERVKKYCFEELNLQILWAGHFIGNTKSKRVIEKCHFNYKFTKEHTLRRLGNKKVETMYYSLEK